MQTEFLIKDYYAILGVGRYAGLTEIRAAFRGMALKTHPDITKEPNNYERFILIREAYDVLTDPRRRTDYDRLWTIHHDESGSVDLGSDEAMGQAFDNFEAGDAYREEWEYFIRHPDDYLGLYESFLKAAFGSALSVLSGLGTAIAVVALVFIALPSLALAAASLITAFAATSLASVVLVVILFRLLRRARRGLRVARKRFAESMGRLVVRPLRGIPRQTGRWIIYFNYATACVLLALFAYVLVMYAGLGEGVDSLLALVPVGGAPGVLLLSALLAAAVALFAVAVPLMFEVVREALLEYPNIRYIKVTLKRGEGIEYVKRKELPAGRNEK
jgi:hypothetical protein